ncbi:MAG: hypothetical protein EBZ49_04285 [Proteobacteria bacterium]|nr:hypothetical protein [Pseudomonadota bacterium]
MKSKKPFDQYTKDEIEKYKFQFIKNTLRRASYRWPWRSVATKRAWLEWGKYKCENCKKVIAAKEKQLDHKLPVVDLKKGFQGWDEYCERLFVGSEGFQVLCLSCHAEKTNNENEKRRKYRNG